MISPVHFMCVFVFLLSTSRAMSMRTPTFIHPCEDMSSQCLRSSIQSALPGFARGIPELGISPLDPIQVDKLDYSISGIQMSFRSGYAKGFRKCVVDFARMDKNNLELQLRCNLIINGKYKSSGRLMVFPLNGGGDLTIKCRNLRLHFIFKLGSIIEGNGEKYLEIKDFNASHSYEGRVSYNVTNLIKGNSEISKNVLKFMNNNWRVVAEDFGKPFVEFGVKSIINNIKQFFRMVPLNQLIK